MPDTGLKRKRPPTFHRFPAKRAKKLKKTWVEKAKIKSKWKAQKRREEIKPSRPEAPQPWNDGNSLSTEDEADEDGSDNETPKHHSDPDTAGFHEPVQAADSTSDEAEDSAEEMDDENAAHSPSPPLRPPPRQPGTRPPPKKKFNNHNHDRSRLPHDENNNARDGAINGDGDKPSLRDLFQKAYSKSSLHTYKSDPLKKRMGDHAGIRGRGGASTSRGRGQPNMKLRMNAMLEKIKRDYS